MSTPQPSRKTQVRCRTVNERAIESERCCMFEQGEAVFKRKLNSFFRLDVTGRAGVLWSQSKRLRNREKAPDSPRTDVTDRVRPSADMWLCV